MRDMRMNEQVIRFEPSQTLVGIVTQPAPALANPDLPAVVLLNAGLLHRVGPNRIYVQLARKLAGFGFTVLRFDFSGMGDSRPREDHLPYVQSAPAEAKDAMDWLTAHCGQKIFGVDGPLRRRWLLLSIGGSGRARSGCGRDQL